jgi:hypothetical protein
LKIPPDAIIPREKITEYLLRPRKQDDKSRFLGRLGFSIDAPEVLEAAIRQRASEGEAVMDAKDVYGESFVLTANLTGPRDALAVRSIWIRRAGETAVRFVTLYPAKEQR